MEIQLKIVFLSISGKIVTKNRAFGNNNIFLQQFFRLRGVLPFPQGSSQGEGGVRDLPLSSVNCLSIFLFFLSLSISLLPFYFSLFYPPLSTTPCQLYLTTTSFFIFLSSNTFLSPLFFILVDPLNRGNPPKIENIVVVNWCYFRKPYLQ